MVEWVVEWGIQEEEHFGADKFSLEILSLRYLSTIKMASGFYGSRNIWSRQIDLWPITAEVITEVYEVSKTSKWNKESKRRISWVILGDANIQGEKRRDAFEGTKKERTKEGREKWEGKGIIDANEESLKKETMVNGSNSAVK